jgi:hypothetical protein
MEGCSCGYCGQPVGGQTGGQTKARSLEAYVYICLQRTFLVSLSRCEANGNL